MRKLFTRKAGMSYLQITILIIATFAFAYIIHEPYKSLEGNSEQELIKEKVELEKQQPDIVNNLLKSLLISIADSITKPILPIVSAQEEDLALWTCREDKSGAICQEYPSINCDENCKSACFPGRRNELTACRQGCCISPDGKCSANSPKAECEDNNGIWKSDKNCNPGNIPECRLGCCVLGESVRALVTEKECDFYSSNAGLEIDYRDGLNEPECLALASSQEKGACVIGSSCRFGTEQECYGLSGQFYSGFLCTHPDLNTDCKRSENTICGEGKDELYFIDSCGNPGNIYDSSKINDNEYWERIFTSNEICGQGGGNANSRNCGNCNSFLGSICKNYKLTNANKPRYGENICADMSCKNAPDNNGKKKDRKNGESWCVYDGAIGNGKDLVGSRHWKYSCFEGEVKIEPCDDFRNSICSQTDIDIGEGEKFSVASCRLNQWQMCMGKTMEQQGCMAPAMEKYNECMGEAESVDDMRECDDDVEEGPLLECREEVNCEENPDCYLKTIDLSKEIPKFDVCLAQYSPGFDTKNGEAAKIICSQASQSCDIVYESQIGGWKCIANCRCEKSEFTSQMAEWCRSLGDCGFKKNIAGECTKNYKLKSEEGEKSDEEAETPDNEVCVGSTNWGGNYPEVPEVSGLIFGGGGIEVSGESGYEPGESEIVKIVNTLGFISGASATAFAAYVWLGGPPLLGGMGIGASFGNAAGSAGTALAVSAFLTWALELKGQAADIMAVTGLIGAIVTFAITLSEGGATCLSDVSGFSCVVMIVVIIILIVVAAFLKIFGIGETETRTVTFTCQAWQPPTGGDKCDECNQEDKPCSKYRCQSLGAACKFINEGTTNELCITSVNDKKAPEISFFKEILSQGYKFEKNAKGVEIKTKDDDCIPEFTPITLGIKTDEVSQCKINLRASANFELMGEEYFGGSNFFLYNHSMSISLPSVESLLEQYNITRENIEENYGNYKIYVRCQDDWGNFNLEEYLIKMCVKQGPDIMPPRINKFEPADGSYLKYNLTEKFITVYANEPASCKYSSEDKNNYNLMEKNMSCSTSLASQTVFGWPCTTSLTGLEPGDNKFYFRCKDKPWLSDNNETRFAMQQSKDYTLKISESELKITSLEPNETIVVGGEPASVILKAETSGGVENGKAGCSWEMRSWQDDFFNTWSTEHSSSLSLYKGEYNLEVFCEDVAGNTAQAETNFEIKTDKSAPRIIRFYKSGDNLNIFTDENSECSYSNENCRFRFENGTEMRGGFSQSHSAKWTTNTYYIKCKDVWGNGPSECSIKIQPEPV